MRRWSKSRETDASGLGQRRIELTIAFVVALVLHLLFLPFLGQQLSRENTRHHQPPKKMQVRMVPKSSIKKLAHKEKKKKDIKPEKTPDKQLVTIARSEKQERSEKADYVAEFDRKVDFQTKSSLTAPHPDVSDRPQVGKPKVPRRAQTDVPEQRAGKPKEEQPLRHQGLKEPESIKAARKKWSAQRKPLRKKEPDPSESIDLSQGGKNKLNLLPSWRELEQYAGMPFNDHLENIEEDAQTRLNTFEWKHATFFNRIKETVSRAWEPVRQIQRYDPQGTLLARRDRFTVVKVSIDREGNIVAVNIGTPSGVHYLDEEAIRAFKAAAPFPNPPKAIFGSNDTFTFPFGFYVGYEKGVSLDFDWKPY